MAATSKHGVIFLATGIYWILQKQSVFDELDTYKTI